MDAYRFNTIRWSASNLHEPSWGKRIGLFLQTRNPVAILRDEYLNNRSSLLNKWESIQPEPHPDGAGSDWQDASSGQGQEYFQEPWQYCKEDKATAGIRRMPRYEPRKTAPGDIQIYPIFSL